MSNEHLMTCAYTADLRVAPLPEAKALFAQYLEVLRPHISELDANESVISDMFGVDEYGFDEEGVDRLYQALVGGYVAIQEEHGLINSYQIPMGDRGERWFSVVGGEGYSYDPFDAWGALWVLLHAIMYVPELRRLGVHGLGIVTD
jgi:hypothetical protein